MIRAVVAVAAAVGAALIPVAGADTSASRSIDRTFSCSVKSRAGAARIEPGAHSGFRDPDRPSRWKWLAHVGIDGRSVNGYIWMVAGAPQPAPPEGLQRRPWHWVTVHGIQCAPSSARVAHSSSGLVGGLASQLVGSDEYDCAAPRRVLVRVGARFRADVEMRRILVNQLHRYATTAGVPAISATLTMATPRGRPLVHARVSESGKATLFSSPTCVPD